MSCSVTRAWCAQQRNRWSVVADELHGCACLVRATTQLDIGGRKRMAWRQSAAARRQVGHPRVAVLRALSTCNRATGGTGARQRAWRWGQQRGRCIALLTSAKRHDTEPHQHQSAQHRPRISLPSVDRSLLNCRTTQPFAAPRPNTSCTAPGPAPPHREPQIRHSSVCSATASQIHQPVPASTVKTVARHHRATPQAHAQQHESV